MNHFLNPRQVQEGISKLITQAASVLACSLDSARKVGRRGTLAKLASKVHISPRVRQQEQLRPPDTPTEWEGTQPGIVHPDRHQTF